MSKVVRQKIEVRDGVVGRLSIYANGETNWQILNSGDLKENANNSVKPQENNEKIELDVNNFTEETIEQMKETVDKSKFTQEYMSEVEEVITLRPLDEFKKKDDLEVYGLEFGIDLNKKKTLANMYKDLEAHIAS